MEELLRFPHIQVLILSHLSLKEIGNFRICQGLTTLFVPITVYDRDKQIFSFDQVNSNTLKLAHRIQKFGAIHCLAWACFGQSVNAQLLLEFGADPNKKDPSYGYPLIIAAITGSAEIVQCLLTKGANTGVKNGREKDALRLAIRKQTGSVVDLLLGKGAFIRANHFDAIGKSGSVEVFKVFEKYGLTYNPDWSADFERIFLYACEKGHLSLIQYLVEKIPKINAFIFSHFLVVGMESAIKHGQEQIVAYLIPLMSQHFCRMIYSSRDDMINSFIGKAIWEKRLKIVQYLWEQSSQLRHYSKIRKWMTQALRRGQPKIVEFLANTPEFISPRKRAD